MPRAGPTEGMPWRQTVATACRARGERRRRAETSSEPRHVGLGLVVVVLMLLPAAVTAADGFLWEAAEGCRSYEGTLLFVTEYPDSPRAQEGRECLERWDAEDAEWDSVKDCEDVGRVEAFLRNHPEGRYSEQAGACLARLRDSDVESLLALCEMRFEMNWLTTGVGGTAVECYREVLSRDPTSLRAMEGMRRVFEKFAGRARNALEKGDVEKALMYAGKLRELSPEAPEVEELNEAVARLESEAEDDAAFERADSEGTLEGYDRYVADNPQGRHVAEAERRIEELTIPAHGEQFRDCEVCPLMVVVRAGSFMMGSPASEAGHLGNESPVHDVAIAKPFAVGVYEVTFGEWDACVSEGGCNGYHPHDKGWGRGTRPVINVSWDDAQAYAGWLSEKTGKRYRLLSESEWEYVARAETKTQYWWGSSIGSNWANCAGCGSRWDNKRTAPVGSFSANGFGLHDVHGNVWEWVEDCWHGDYGGAPLDGSAWTSGGNCGARVLRGGSWDYAPWVLRSALRNWDATAGRSVIIGFRVARTLTP